MCAAGGGSIINIASTAGIEGVAGALPYTASKHAVVGMTRAAALELAALKIRVNVVCPGGMATPLLVESLGVPLERSRRWIFRGTRCGAWVIRTRLQGGALSRLRRFLVRDRLRCS